MERKNTLAKNSIFYLMYNVLNIAFPLVTGIYVSRVLLKSQIGEVAAAQNIAQYFVVFAFLGIPSYGMREISKVRRLTDERNKLYSELYVINLMSTITFCLVYLILIFSIPTYRQNINLYLITGGSIALNAFRNDWLFEGMEEFTFISIRNIVFKVVSFALLIGLVRDPSDYYWYAGITVLGTAGHYLVNMLFSAKFVRFTFKGLNLRRHVKPILWLTAVNLAIEIYTLVDVTMLDCMSGKENVAIYSYGSKIHKMLLQIINTFTIVIVPRISIYYKEKKYNEFNQLLTRTLNLLILLSVPMIVGLFFASTDIICFLYTDLYANSAVVLKLLSPILLISPIGYLLGSRVLLSVEQESKMMISVFAGAVTNIIFNYFMIPILQEYGAAVASVVGETVVMVVYITLSRRYIQISGIMREVSKIFFSALVMGAVLATVANLHTSGLVRIIIEILTGITTYAVMLLVFRESFAVAFVKKLGSVLYRQR